MGRPRKKRPAIELPDEKQPDWLVTMNGEKIPVELVETANKVGFTLSQIVSFSTLDALKDAIYRLDPVARIRLDEQPAPKPISVEPPKPVEVEKTVTFMVSVAEWMTTSANHAAMEEMQIQSKLRALTIRNIQSLSIVRSYIADKKGQLVSQVTVNYKEQA